MRTLAALLVAAGGFFALYEVVERPGSQIFGSTLVHGRGHVVALTFDDGPDERTTPAVLHELESAHVHATFFVVGRAASRHPGLLRRMLRDGDEIGNHTEDHAHLNFLLSAAAIGREIDRAQRAIEAATGRRPTLLRPPFGARDFAALDAARRRGLRVVMWSAMLGDAGPHSERRVLERRLLAQVSDGAIIVVHDGDQGRDDAAGRTYESAIVRPLIDDLRRRGYRFITVSALAGTLHA